MISVLDHKEPGVATTLYEKHGYAILERRTLPDGLVLARFHKSPTGRFGADRDPGA